MNSPLLDDLRQVLSEGKVDTQEDICEALQQKGHTINQSKVSRLLRKIGAIKSKDEQGQIVYRLPHEPAPPTMLDPLSSVVIDLVANETTIIVYTSPGSGQLIARLIDYHRKKLQILGTIAGDDTVLIAPKSINNKDETIEGLKELLFY